MSLLPAHSRRNGGADDERPTDGAGTDGEQTATGTPDGQAGQPAAGRTPERPRYAFAYAPPDDAPDDDVSDAASSDDDAADDDAPGRNVVAGSVVSDDVEQDDVESGDPADELDDDAPAVTRPNPIPAPTVEVPATGVDRLGPSGGTVPAPRPAADPAPAPAGTAEIEEPLLTDATALRARWQRAQLDFVDDPRAAVTDADVLVEQTVQAMVAAVQQRQRQLRQESAATGNPDDTERLRLTMRGYRALFNQICPR